MGVWDMYFVLELRRKRKTFYIKFNSIIFLQFFFSHSFKWIIIMDICIQFIIVAFYDELIANKVL